MHICGESSYASTGREHLSVDGESGWASTERVAKQDSRSGCASTAWTAARRRRESYMSTERERLSIDGDSGYARWQEGLRVDGKRGCTSMER
ncbi:unnamed protein product [Lampetra planeri]